MEESLSIDATHCVHYEIETRARAYPDRVALIFRDTVLTYQQLDARAAKIASILQTCGAGPDVPVAIAIERSLEMVVAMLAVLKAGGAYLPLDPAFPRERVDFILKDGNARAILTSSALHDQFVDRGVPIICVDSDGCSPTPPVSDNAALSTSSHDLAYLMYTSGSTGQPKGVMVEHRNVISFFAAMDHILGNESPGVWLAVTSISFDISVLELLWTLARGFTVVIQPIEGKLETSGADSIAALVARHSVSHLQTTPAHAQMLTRSESAMAALASLKYWLIGGEAFPPALARQIRAALPARIINMYGPTESTVWSTSYEIAGGEQTIPIGTPLANTYFRILDPNGSITKPGEMGELYIGGAGVTRGYWKRPELTAERFAPDPFSAASGARFYRTGDLVRENADGQIEFLGRADFQVKIRGFRVELGEIEAVLGNHPAVREAIVAAQPNAWGEQQLVAYIVVREESGLSAAELRIYSRQKLPEYMRPTAFEFLAALPMTPNGKVDRKALGQRHEADNHGAVFDAAGMNTLEKRIAAEWQDLLGGIAISLHSNFFDLGANSLTVAEAASRLRERLGLEVKITDLFAYPTVAALAANLGRATPAPANTAGVERGAARRAALAARTRRTV